MIDGMRSIWFGLLISGGRRRPLACTVPVGGSDGAESRLPERGNGWAKGTGEGGPGEPWGPRGALRPGRRGRTAHPAAAPAARPRGAPYPSRMHDDELRETPVDGRIVHQGRYVTFRVDRVRDADGGIHTRDWVDHPGAVAILALDAGSVLMVRQFRTPAGRVLLEIPAGTLERLPGGGTEDPDGAARRELGEETGRLAASWRTLGRFYPAPGFASELMHLYLATDLAPVPDYAGPEADERIAVARIGIADALAMADRGEIEDAKTLVALFWLARLADRGEIVL